MRSVRFLRIASRWTILRLAFSAAAVTAVVGTPGTGAVPPADFTDTLVASVSSPTAMAFAPGGRILVTTQFGVVRVIANDALVAQPALDLSASLCTSNEMGLLGVEVHPSFPTNGFVYLYYTRNVAGACQNRVSRFVMSGNVIAPSTETVLIDRIPATEGNHNAGDLHFGKDGFLYVSVGDGGCDYAGGGCGGSNDAARDQHILLGKVLRITSTGGIPPTNPFLGAGTARCASTGRTTAGLRCQETFAWGLRNPFRLAFDPNAPGTRFFINDVGQNVWEEVDEGVAGADYGWNVREGPCANGSETDCGPPPAGMTNPVHSYSHGECNAITGGAFVPNGIWPSSYNGTYLYGDYTCGKIFLLTPNGSGGYTRSEFATDVGAVVNLAFGPAPVSQAPSGRALYYTNYTNGGEVRRIAHTGATNRAPTAAVTASPTFGPPPLNVAFDGSTSSDPDPGDTLTYIWSFGDGTPTQTTTTATTTHTYTAAGIYNATLIVRDNHGASSTPASVQIAPGESPPQVTIDTPTASTLFGVGQSLTLHGTATDAQDGTLAASRLTWTVLKHHDTHTHPFLAPTSGNDLQITGPAPEDLLAATNSFLEIQLTATDSRGLSTTVTRNVQPHKVDLTLATNPAGLKVSVNGEQLTGPTTITSWRNWALEVGAQAQVDDSGRSWTFSSWSDGGAASHQFTTPSSATTLTATFTQSATPVGLVAAYGLNEGTGSAVADSSGKSNGGTVSGATWTTAGKYGAALSFDGVDDWVTVADAASLDVTQTTLEAWVRPTTAGGTWRTAVFKEQPGGMVYALYANQGGGQPLGQVNVGGERNALGPTLPLNAWSHLAATFDGSALRLYVNGALASTTAIAGSIPASTGPLRIGGNGIWAEWFEGQIDEVRVYDRALTQAEIQSDMQTPVGGTAPPPADTQPPTSPGSLAASASSDAVDLTWQASTDNVGVTGYDVHRGAAGFAPTAGNKLARVTTTAYRDSGLAAGMYSYKVIAVDAAGNPSAPSNEASATVAPAPAPSGLVAAYSFDEGQGTSVVDRSGSSNGGSVTGATWTTAGKYGSALSFDGVDDWVTAADSTSLDVSRMTLEAWVRPTAVGGGWRTALFKEQPGGMVYALYASQGSGASLGQVNIGGERNAQGPALALNTWSHLAATFDGSALRLYVNGTLASTTAVAGSIPASTGTLRIGGNGVWGEWFAGQIDEVRVYDRALTASEIQSDLQTPVGGSAPPPPPLSDTQAPTAPPGLTAAASPGTVDLTWQASTDNVGVTGYDVHRSTTSGFTPGAANRLARVTTTSYRDSGLAAGTYYYRVIAVDAAGNASPPSAQISAAVPGAPSSGLVAAYSFNDGAGTSITDSAGGANPGSISGATWTTAGKYGSALSFDGVNDWVTVSDSASLDVTRVTLEAWVRPTALGSMWRTVLHKEQPGGMVYALYANQGFGLPLGQVNIGGARNALGANLPLNTWSHLAVTYDGAVLRLFVNGTAAGTVTVSGSIPASTGPLRIGGNAVRSEWFAGQIDEVRVYNRALTQSEIQADRSTPIP